ncbi:hypothetical protein [Vibrio navarrensis]|uniref:hypothetical protein n=1 Tax=Vibrio navarrensis TaxID=29495 RepID=UPI00051DC41C|nr:hypothetical protein [Vibrio navarrensis]KGK16812.1 hypothetical protein EA24_17870 [Vibrio navarrensis]
MKHYRDITSFHSIGKAISGHPESTKNIVDLLNFLSQVIFCDEIAVSVLGPKEITDGTIEVVEKLISLGIPKELIRRYSYPDGSERIHQRNRIADQLKFDWINHFPVLGKASRDSFPPGYYDMLSNTIDIFSDTLLTNTSVANYQREINESLNDDSISYMVGLMLSDRDLTDYIRYNFKKQGVTRDHLIHFIALSRNKYNLLLSEDLKLIFTPSASRAQANHTTAYSFMDTYRKKLNKDPHEEMQRLKLTGKQYELDIPSALHILLADKATSAEQLIVKALDAREKVAWYRDEVLNEYNELKFSGEIKDKIELSNRLDSAYNDIASVLNTNGAGYSKTLFGHFSVDLSDFSSAAGSMKAVGDFLKLTKNKWKFRKNQDCYLLTQELIHYMSKDQNEHKETVQRLYLALGGEYKNLYLSSCP